MLAVALEVGVNVNCLARADLADAGHVQGWVDRHDGYYLVPRCWSPQPAAAKTAAARPKTVTRSPSPLPTSPGRAG